MNKQHYKKLEEKIKEACPDIMKLKFGREVIIDIPRGDYNSMVRDDELENKKVVMISKMNWDSHGFDWFEYRYWLHGDAKNGSTRKKNIKEIIGRPINLDDCVKTIGKKLKNGDVVNCHINDRGELTFSESVVDWLPNTPLSEQSEETKQLLYNLICKK